VGPLQTRASVQLANPAIRMSVLSVYRRTGGGYVLSHEPMRARHTRHADEPLMGIGVVESELLGAKLRAHLAQQLAQASHAFVSAELFDGRGRVGGHLHDRR
jgi:hypothetical protein